MIRDKTIDILRGLAIFTMIAANISPYMLREPHPFWFRIYGSFAAPFFILISGMMVAHTAQTKGHGFRYYLIRGMLIVLIGALIDVLVWNILPFTTVDVLYLIGISLPIAYVFSRLNNSNKWIIVMIILLATPLVQNIFGYSDYPSEFFLSGEPTIIVENQTPIINHWFIDGWFPIFPWLGFSLFGVILANLRSNYRKFGKNFLIYGSHLVLIGIIIWYLYPGKLLTRAGFGELFYPPTIGYIITTIGLIIIIFFLVDYNTEIIAYSPLMVLGESSLFMYISHIVLGKFILTPIWSNEDIGVFFLIYLGLSIFLILIAYGLRTVKGKWKDRPFIIQFLFGS